MKAITGTFLSSWRLKALWRCSLHDSLPLRSSGEKKLSNPWNFAERKWSVFGFHSSMSMPLRTPSRCGKRRRQASWRPQPPSGERISSLYEGETVTTRSASSMPPLSSLICLSW